MMLMKALTLDDWATPMFALMRAASSRDCHSLLSAHCDDWRLLSCESIPCRDLESSFSAFKTVDQAIEFHLTDAPEGVVKEDGEGMGTELLAKRWSALDGQRESHRDGARWSVRTLRTLKAPEATSRAHRTLRHFKSRRDLPRHRQSNTNGVTPTTRCLSTIRIHYNHSPPSSRIYLLLRWP